MPAPLSTWRIFTGHTAMQLAQIRGRADITVLRDEAEAAAAAAAAAAEAAAAAVNEGGGDSVPAGAAEDMGANTCVDSHTS